VTAGDPAPSRIGLGLYPFAGGYGTVDRGEAARTLDVALDHGWSFLDTAEAYGDSEELLGSLLGDRRERVFLATKAFPCERYTARSLRAALEASLRRLRTDHVDLYQLHGPENWLLEGGTPVEEVAAALEELEASGLARHVGVCNFSAAELAELHRHTPVYSIQNLYGLLDRRAGSDVFQFGVEEEILPLTTGAGIKFVAYSPLGRGLLAEGLDPEREFDVSDERHFLPRFQPGVYGDYVHLAGALADWAHERGRTLPQLAVAWVLRTPGVSSVLVGAKSVAQVEALAGADEWRITPGDAAELNAILATLSERARSAQASVFEHIPDERLTDLRRRRYDESLAAPIRYSPPPSALGGEDRDVGSSAP
jgi:aryl-alcohol dehydrogenase-like predicted oxidoreductase